MNATVTKEPKYKFEPKEVKAMKDKNETILKIGDRVKDSKGEEWRLENIRGVSMIVSYKHDKRDRTKVLRKVDLTTYVKVA